MISIIIPSYNGRHALPNLLSRLERQQVRAAQVIVVLDGSTDDSLIWLQQYALESSLPLEVIYQKNKGRAGARNTGVAQAIGEVLLFFDDDMLPEPNCIAQHQAFHREHRNAVCVGRVDTNPGSAHTDFQRYRCALEASWLRQEGWMDEQVFLSAANLSIPMSIWQQVGGFDERLSDGEDAEWGERAAALEVPVYFSPQIVAWHDDMVNLRQFIRREREYRAAEQDRKGYYRMGVGFRMKQLAFRPLASNKLLKLVESRLFAYLPQGFKYRCYAYIVAAWSTYHPETKIKEELIPA